MSAPLHLQLAAELESMASAAASKGYVSVSILRDAAKTMREGGAAAPERELRDTFQYIVDAASDIDTLGPLEALMRRWIL